MNKTLTENLYNTNLINRKEISDDFFNHLDKLISIIIPLYNEEKTIKHVLNKIPKEGNFEIIIVDDGSTDNSIQKIKELNRKDLKIRIIRHKINMGYGQAILTGFNKASGDIIVTLDSDGQHDPRDMIELIQPIINDKAEIVIGSRYLGKCYYSIPFYTQMGELLIKIILKLLFNMSVGNNQSGFRAFKNKTLNIFEDLENKGMGLTTEILFQAGLNKIRVKEVPIHVFPRKYGFSYVNLFKIIRSIFSCFIYYFIKKIFRLK